MKVIIILSMIILFIPHVVYSENQAIPYTTDALAKLHAAKNSESDTSQTDQVDIRAKLYIDYQRKIFKKAGYDFDKSIVKYLQDIKKGEEYILSKASVSSPLSYLKNCVIYLNSFKQKEILSQYLSREVTDALTNYGNIHSVKQAEITNKAMSDSKTKTQHHRPDITETLKRLQGFYGQFLRGSGGYEEQGEANIQIVSEDQMLFSFVSRLMTSYQTRGSCSIENATARLSSDGYDGRGNSYSAIFEENDCRLGMHFRLNARGVEMFTINQTGSCSLYCTKGRKLTGQAFTKKLDQKNAKAIIKDDDTQQYHSQDAKQQIAKDWLEKALSYKASGNYNEAIKAVNKAIELYPRDALGYYARGDIYWKAGNYQQVIKELDKAIGLKADFAPAYNIRGCAYNMLGNYQQAITDLNKAIELDSKYTIAYCNRGMIYEELGNINMSMEDYKIAAQLGSKQAQDILSKIQSSQKLP